MSGLNVGQVGIAGEVRCVLKREDGSIKEDTGFQKNLILNQGLNFLGSDLGNMFEKCAIGSGNTTPVATQTQLDSFLAVGTGAVNSGKYDYVPDASNTYKTNQVYKYVFTGLNNVNVSEVGLASSTSTDSISHVLYTRALLKDVSGAPTTITILQGEVLEVYYKLWVVYSTLDAEFVVNMLDGKGGSVPYNTKVRNQGVGVAIFYNYIGSQLYATSVGDDYINPSSADLVGITAKRPEGLKRYNSMDRAPYITDSYKRGLILNIAVADANASIRTFGILTSMGAWQIRFGSVVDDSPIPKTNLKTLSMHFEVSWGRYEGVL